MANFGLDKMVPTILRLQQLPGPLLDWPSSWSRYFGHSAAGPHPHRHQGGHRCKDISHRRHQAQPTSAIEHVRCQWISPKHNHTQLTQVTGAMTRTQALPKQPMILSSTSLIRTSLNSVCCLFKWSCSQNTYLDDKVRGSHIVPFFMMHASEALHDN